MMYVSVGTVMVNPRHLRQHRCDFSYLSCIYVCVICTRATHAYWYTKFRENVLRSGRDRNASPTFDKRRSQSIIKKKKKRKIGPPPVRRVYTNSDAIRVISIKQTSSHAKRCKLSKRTHGRVPDPFVFCFYVNIFFCSSTLWRRRLSKRKARKKKRTSSTRNRRKQSGPDAPTSAREKG